MHKTKIQVEFDILFEYQNKLDAAYNYIFIVALDY